MLSALSSVEASEIRNRDFWDTGFGALAYTGVTTTSLRKPKIELLDRCLTLPKYRAQHFLINHYNTERAGESGYFLIQVLLLKKKVNQSERDIEFIDLSRNRNWYPEVGPFGEISTELNLIEAVFSAHAASSYDEALQTLPEKFSRWHASVDQNGPHSFTGTREHIRKDDARPDYVQRYKFRIIRATLTNTKGSDDTPDFRFETGDSDSAIIRISAPLFGLAPTTYHVSFDGPCAPAAQN
jgi:hypothetical protein